MPDDAEMFDDQLDLESEYERSIASEEQASPALGVTDDDEFAEDDDPVEPVETGTADSVSAGSQAASSPSLEADFDGDGRADLAIAVNTPDGGAVHVIYGTDRGLDAADDQLWSQDVIGVPGNSDPGDDFGRALAAGDFDGDGYADLAIGVPGEDLGPITNAGAVIVVYGTADGLSHVGSEIWHQDRPGIRGIAEGGDFFGRTLTTGDFDGDGFDDLAVGAPFEDLNNGANAGAVNIIPGSANGLTANGDQVWHQNSRDNMVDIWGIVEPFDLFGDALAAGDFNNDGFDDLAIGVPLENYATPTNDGVVNVIYGTANGLSAVNNQLWSQYTRGVPGIAEPNDLFGFALTVGDFNGDNIDDLAVGVPYEDLGPDGVHVDAGALNVIYGSANRLTGTGAQSWHQNSAGVFGASEIGDRFGYALAAGDFDNDGRYDLAIGVPGEMLPRRPNDAGIVQMLRGSNGGITAVGDQVRHQDTAGIQGVMNADDAFGRVLSVGDFDGDNRDDVAIGVPFEDLGSLVDAGAVNVLYAFEVAGNQLWHRNSPGVIGAAAGGQRFGRALR